MKLDCLIIGSEGQGTVMAAKLLAKTATNLGHNALTWETISIVEKGGCIVSHVRIGEYENSMIPLGLADLILSTDPAQAIKYFAYLKPQGQIIVCSNPVIAANSASGSTENSSTMLDLLRKKAYQLTVVDGDKLCNLAGNIKALNIILLGASIAKKAIPFSQEDIEKTIRTHINPKLWQINIQGLGLGVRYNIL